MAMRRSRLKLAPNLGAKTRGPAAAASRVTAPAAKGTNEADTPGSDVKPVIPSVSRVRRASGGLLKKTDETCKIKDKSVEISPSKNQQSDLKPSMPETVVATRVRRLSGHSTTKPGLTSAENTLTGDVQNKTVTRMRTKSTSSETTKDSLPTVVSPVGLAPSSQDKVDPTLIMERVRTKSSSSVESHDSSKENLLDEKDAIEEEVRPVLIKTLEETPVLKQAAEEKEKAVKPAPRVRSRFPKARPNLAEAGRPRVRHLSSLGVEPEDDLRSPPPVQRTVSATDSPARGPQKGEKSSSMESGNPGATAPQEDWTAIKTEKVSARKNARAQEKDEEKDVNRPKRRKLEWIDGPIDRTKLTMRDLIYMNPVANPMQSSVDAKERKKKKREEDRQKAQNPLSDDGEDDTRSEAGSVHTIGSVGEDQQAALEDKVKQGVSEDKAKQDIKDDDDAMPVPQVTIGADGEIILNESSLVINTNKEVEEDKSMELIHEHDGPAISFMYGRRTSSKMWTERETKKFYLALSAVGTDFSLMGSLFPKRNRTELKRKFKREEKINHYLVERAIRERQQFDQDFFDHLAELNVEEPAEKTPRGRRGRRSSKAKKINESDTEAKDGEGTSKVKPEKKPRGKKSAKSQPGGSSLTSEGTAETAEPSSIVKKPRRQRKPRAKKTKPYKDSDSETDTEFPSENDPNITRLDDDEADDVLLKNIRRPTRAGRQPKPRLFEPEEPEVKRSRKASKEAINANEAESEAMGQAQFIPLSNLVQSPAPAESQTSSYVFVTSKPTVNEKGKLSPQVLHVYLVSPSGSIGKSGEATDLPPGGVIKHHPTASPLGSPLSPRPMNFFKPIPGTADVSTRTSLQPQDSIGAHCETTQIVEINQSSVETLFKSDESPEDNVLPASHVTQEVRSQVSEDPVTTSLITDPGSKTNPILLEDMK